jgi:CubicO group peptidase (beta-lactamase class C family)
MADDANGIPNMPETRFRLGSVTKQFTAMAVLMLASQGPLKTTDPLCDYVDTCPDGWDRVTIEHLLSHSSGIASFTDQPGFDPMKAATPADTVASVADIPLAFEPGASFAYNNTGYVLLGMVIERASGLDYETFLVQHIFEPLGMADSGYEHGDTPGLAVGYASEFEQSGALDMSVPYAAGGLYSTVLDLQRWVDALDADALVDAVAMQRFVTPLADTADGGTTGYAYGVSVGDEDGHRVVSHSGVINGFSTYLAWYPDDGLTIALLTNREEGPDLSTTATRAAALALESPQDTEDGSSSRWRRSESPPDAPAQPGRVDQSSPWPGRGFTYIGREAEGHLHGGAGWDYYVIRKSGGAAMQARWPSRAVSSGRNRETPLL